MGSIKPKLKRPGWDGINKTETQKAGMGWDEKKFFLFLSFTHFSYIEYLSIPRSVLAEFHTVLSMNVAVPGDMNNLHCVK